MTGRAPAAGGSKDVPPEVVDSFLRARGNRPRWTGVAAEHRPRTIDEGYRVQAAVHRRLIESGARRVGYKVGATSAAGQNRYGLAEPVYAGLFEETRSASLREALSRPLLAPAVECEIAVVLGTDLDARRTTLDDRAVTEAIGQYRIACEIIDERYGDALEVGVPSLLADDFFNAGFVLGAAHKEPARKVLGPVQARIELDGVGIDGNSGNVLSAVDAVLWLASKLATQGRFLVAGEIVLTGAIIPPVPIAAPPASLRLHLDGFPTLD